MAFYSYRKSIVLMVMMIVIVGVTVIVGYSSQSKEHCPANVQRREVIDTFADQNKYEVSQQGHYQACSSYKLVRIHFTRVVYLR
jgi:hypothetical protein